MCGSPVKGSPASGPDRASAFRSIVRPGEGGLNLGQPGGLLTACELVPALGYEDGMLSEPERNSRFQEPHLVERRNGNLVPKIEEAAVTGRSVVH